MTTNKKLSGQLAFDTLLDALNTHVRRQILVGLMGSNPLDEGTLPDELDFDGRSENLRTQLRHMHLPKLDEMGVIEWDRHTGRIARGGKFDQILPALQLLNTHQRELPGNFV